MKLLLAILFALPVMTFSGCTGNSEVAPLTKGTGKDPTPEEMKKYIEESKAKGGGPGKGAKMPTPAPGTKK